MASDTMHGSNMSQIGSTKARRAKDTDWHELVVSPLYERVATEIKRHILENQLRPGAKLPSETELAQLLGVSRSSVREGLRVLQILGMVETRVGQGSFVGHFELEEIVAQMSFRLGSSHPDYVDLMEMRELLELKAVELAANRIKQDSLDEMEAVLGRMEEKIKSGASWVDEDIAFHEIIFRASGNKVLLTMVDAITGLLRSIRHAGIKLADTDDEIEQHTAIYRALRGRDADRASDLMTIHLRTAATQMFGALELDKNGSDQSASISGR
jgi:GntR family transcriptional repressor for pyruvate dehydrogenase complex